MSICSTGAPPNQDASPLAIARVDGLKPLLVPAVVSFELLGVKTTTGWGLIKDKKLEAVHIGNRCHVVVASIERLVEELRENERANEQRTRKGLIEATAASVASPNRKRGRPRKEARLQGAGAQ